jgi:hypothetical protein
MLLPSGTDPCGLLNSTAFPQLWIAESAVADSNAALIGSRGVLITYKSLLDERLAATPEGTVLASASSDSSLTEFLSKPALKTLSSIVLRPQAGGETETIVDTYIIGARGLNKGNTYLYTDVLSDTDLWRASDATAEGTIVTSPTSVLGKLIRSGYLLSQADIYSVDPNVKNTLLSLYRQKQQGEELSSEQRELRLALESKNKRFFAAFLAEYCFYRTRYRWVLKKYMNIFGTKPDSFQSPTITSDLVSNLFSGAASSAASKRDNQYIAPVTQTDLLMCLAYHAAALNRRMIDLRRLLSAITTYYTASIQVIQEQTNNAKAPGSTQRLTESIVALQNSAEDAQKTLDKAEFQKSAMEYTKQKNRYANFLLGVYAFLNIAAVSMIFHLS